MDFSVNKLQTTNKNINFKGLEGSFNKKNAAVYRFYPPIHKDSEKVFLELTYLTADENTRSAKKPNEKSFITKQFEGNNSIDVMQDILKENSPFGFAYRYKIVDKSGSIRYEVDPFKTMDINNKGEKMNVIKHGESYISPKGGTIRHSFLDSDVRLVGDKMVTKTDSEFVRNHFNKLGGNIKGLTYLLNHTDELDPYKYIMTTPDIGADKVTSHRYWPSNQFQCENLQNFKDFNFELFKKGKGYIADGAFTSQGIQSPLVQHVLKWGEESPFYDMLKIDGDITLGILPSVKNPKDGVDPHGHIGVRLVNNPKSNNYNPEKPIYIQFFDDRLLSKEKQNDTKNLHFTYDISPNDHYEITSSQDSIQPYAFEIEPDSDKLKEFKNSNAILINKISKKDKFFTFPHFKIKSKNHVAGATSWDGNSDIIKMNLSNPANTKRNIEGFNNARNYLYDAASYWTELINSELILNTAASSNKEKETIALNNNITLEEYEEIKKLAPNSYSPIIKQNKGLEEFIEQFPLQSLETSEELSAIFSEPNFNKEFLTSKTKEIITATLEQSIDSIIPGKYRNNELYRTYAIKTCANEILRSLYASALRKDCIKNGTVDPNILKNATLKSVCYYTPQSVENEKKQVMLSLSRGVSRQNIRDVEQRLKRKLENITLTDFKLAENIVLQGKGGLNWRFDAAKDIGDLDAVRNGSKTFNEIWNGTDKDPGVQAFWTDFIKRIKQHNPSSYIINELTSLNEFYEWKNDKSMKNFDWKLANEYHALSNEEKELYENHVDYRKLVDFISSTGSTTLSEYDKGFNAFSEFIGVNPENYNYGIVHNEDASKIRNGNVSQLKETMEHLMKFHQPNTAIYSHMFTQNHDKPAVLHTLPLDTEIYLAENPSSIVNQDKIPLIKEITNKTDLKNVCTKAAAVGLAFYKVIENSTKLTAKEKEALTKALRDLVNGIKKGTEKESYKRAESFGVLPYEITIQDLFKNAEIDNKEKMLDFHSELLDVPMKLKERQWQVMNACVGTPTLYGGEEFAQTGYETASKNVYLGIRNEILHGLKDDKRYCSYYNKISKTSSLYQKQGLSALRNGTPVSLDIFNHGDKEFWPLYKYDSKGSKTISVISNIGVKNENISRFSYEFDGNIYNHEIEKIPLSKDGKNVFEEGTKLKRYVYNGNDYVLDKKEYIIKNGAITAANNGKIILNDTVSTFCIA